MKTILKKGIAVNCKTEDEAKEFLAMLDKDGYTWINGDKLTEYSNWTDHGSKTCYCYNFMEIGKGIGYAHINCYINTCKIIPFAEFKKALIQNWKSIITKHHIDGNMTIVKLSNGKVGTANCLPEDKFNEGYGAILAVARAYNIDLNEVIKLIEKKEPELFFAKDIVGKWAVCKGMDWVPTKYRIIFVDDKNMLLEYANGTRWNFENGSYSSTAQAAFGKVWEVVE